MRDKTNRIMATILTFVILLSVFAFTAFMEYDRTIVYQRNRALDYLGIVGSRLESVLLSRMISLRGLVAYAEVNPQFSQEEYSSFASILFDMHDGVVRNMTFLSDTTITHVYPYEEHKVAIGTDLSKVEGQRDAIMYVKENNKAILDAPVALVQGGTGIVVRVPVNLSGEYYGQVSIVFYYDKTIEALGLLELAEEYRVKLHKSNVLNGEKSIIWQCDDHISTNPEIIEVRLYDSKISVEIEPIGGWRGTSNLFWVIALIGTIVSIVSSLSLYNLIRTSEELSKNKVRLVDANENLETSIKMLRDREDKLRLQYDEIKRQEEYIKYLAEHDSLTGLYNRWKFEDRLNRELKGEAFGAVALLDIDNFKNINDLFGHIYGDKLLKHVSFLINEAVSDVGDVFRIGGDEFLILLPNIKSLVEIRALVEEIADRLSMENEIDLIKNRMSASIGVVRYPEDGSNVEDLMMRADVAMYKAKRAGKNRCEIFDESMISIFRHKVNIEKKLREALENDGFCVYYQPVICAKTGDTRYYEALLRLKDFSLSPAEFIPAAEDTGLIVPIGKWVISHVLSQLSLWKTKGYNIMPIAVNVSPRQIHDAGFGEFVDKELQKQGIPSKYLEIEITESVFVEKNDANLKVLNALKELGIRISLDDFGTGYSSINYLGSMPLNKLKLDKSIKDKLLGLDDNKVIKGILDIAHGFDLKVVAEGIEEAWEMEMLKKIGFDMFQGYLFSRPVPSKDIEEELEELSGVDYD